MSGKNCPTEPIPEESELALEAGAIAINPLTESFREWFQRRLVWLEGLAANSNPRIHLIEEREVIENSITSALRMFDSRAEQLYLSHQARSSFHAQLVKAQAAVHAEVMDAWALGSETLKSWGADNVGTLLPLYLTDRVWNWEHRFERALVVQAVVRNRVEIAALLEALERLSAQESKVGASRTVVFIAWDGYSFQSIGSGLFQEALLAAIRRLGLALGGDRNPVQFCLDQLLAELICEIRPIPDPDVSRLSHDQLYTYLSTAYSAESLTPTNGFVNDLCEALQWYCRRLIGASTAISDAGTVQKTPNPSAPSFDLAALVERWRRQSPTNLSPKQEQVRKEIQEEARARLEVQAQLLLAAISDQRSFEAELRVQSGSIVTEMYYDILAEPPVSPEAQEFLAGGIEQELDGEAIWVVRDGEREPAPQEIQAWYAAHDEWDRRAGLVFPNVKVALREELKQVLEREVTFWVRKAQIRSSGKTEPRPQDEAAAGAQSPETASGESRLAAKGRREAVVMPILEKRRWTRGKWVTEAGVGKNSVYDYLEGKRTLTSANREAMAQALGLEPSDLPD